MAEELMEKPDWWPNNPYSDYDDAHPEDEGHFALEETAWNEASDAIWEAVCKRG